jgi:hypothetical protein
LDCHYFYLSGYLLIVIVFLQASIDGEMRNDRTETAWQYSLKSYQPAISRWYRKKSGNCHFTIQKWGIAKEVFAAMGKELKPHER